MDTFARRYPSLGLGRNNMISKPSGSCIEMPISTRGKMKTQDKIDVHGLVVDEFLDLDAVFDDDKIKWENERVSKITEGGYLYFVLVQKAKRYGICGYRYVILDEEKDEIESSQIFLDEKEASKEASTWLKSY